MNRLAAIWKVILTAVAWAGIQLFGGWSQAMTALVILVVLDVITGFIRAFVQQGLSSKESFRGMTKKLLIFVLVAVAVQVDMLAGTNGIMRNVVVIFYCVSEGLSVLENCVASGLPVPDILRQALKQLNEKKFPAGGGG